MAFLGRVDLQKYLAEKSPNHPFAHEQISFVPNQTSSSTNSSETQSKESSASPDPMLAAHNGLEEAMLKQAEKYRATAQQPQAQSPSKDSTTPPPSEAS